MISETQALTFRELRKWLRTPPLVLITLFHPVVWLALFGNAFNPTNLVPNSIGPVQLSIPQLEQIRRSVLNETFGGAPNYITYLTGGILSLLLLFNSAFSGGSLVWDRRFGFLDKLLASPIPRSAIFLSRVLASIAKGLIQAFVIFVVALLLPGGLILGPGFGVLDLVLIFVALFLLALGFSSLFTAMAVRITKWETLVAVVNLLNLPLLFTSSALLPVSTMPEWLRVIANMNPISKSAEIARQFIIQGGSALQSATVTADFIFLIAFATVLSVIGEVTSRLALRAE